MKNSTVTFIALIVGLIGFASGFEYNQYNQPPVVIPKPCPAIKPCPVCDLNVSGRIDEIVNMSLFGKNKRKISIYFNGLDGISGILDANNNGNFVGQYKSTSASAVCSGSESITCTVNFDGKSKNITFSKE